MLTIFKCCSWGS